MKRLFLLFAAILLLCSWTVFAEDNSKFAPQVELVAGVGLNYGQVATVTPQIIFLGDFGNGLSFGPGFGLRAGIVTVKYQITDKIRETQPELDLPLFYRIRYAFGNLFTAVDLGGAFGLYSNYEKSTPKCRISGPFIEPQAGIRLGRFSGSLGFLFYQSDYTIIERKGDMMDQTSFDNHQAFALTVHLAYSL